MKTEKLSFRAMFRKAVALLVAISMPLQSLAASVELATVPMANSTTTTVKPNLMFVLDDSGSMAWDYMPDTAHDFNGGEYGYNSSQCNGIYYNPSVTYDPPVQADGSPLNATATSFTAAYKDGYNTGSGSTNLDTGFRGGSGSGSSGISLTAQSAFYYTYTGTQNTDALRNYFNTSSTFYKECDSNIGSSPGSSVFTLTRLSSIPTTTITVAGGGAGKTFIFTVTVASTSPTARVSRVRLSDGSTDILQGTTSSGSLGSSGTTANNTLATRIRDGINNCTNNSGSGNCDTGNYSAVVGTGGTANQVTVTWNGNGSPPPAGDLQFTMQQGSFTYTKVQDWTDITNATTVSSILVGSTELLTANATGGTPNAVAADIQAKIGNGYSATVATNVVTITGTTASAGLTPVITSSSASSPAITFTTGGPFPDSDPVKLQNFANWYSYYSNRMLMMKTGAGLAFQKVTDSFRVGFTSMNDNVSPSLLSVDTFSGAQKTSFYTKLYQSVASNGTPLREILSRVGQYYAHKFGSVDRYTATIVVGGSGTTSVDKVMVNGVNIMDAETTPTNSTITLAAAIANSINQKQDTTFGASANNTTITISGSASALGQALTVSNDGGGMTFSTTNFVKTTSSSSFNGVSNPADPVQYSCQQNFTILSTDGYWNGPDTYDLNNNLVGNPDALVARPFNDGGQSQTTYTNYYRRNSYARGSTGSCTSGKKQANQTGEIGSCTTTTLGGSCTPSNWTTDPGVGTSLVPNPVGGATPWCVASSGTTGWPPSPSPSLQVLDSTVTTPGATGGTSDTLADVALYYYQTDLRDQSLGNCTGALGSDVCTNNVFVTGTDNNAQQHMTTFTLGLGVRGKMVYSASYLTDTTGDYVAVKLGSVASSSVCTWQTSGTACTWPVPVSGGATTTDDLWHAAVNGRGAYFSATDPTSLANGLSNALVSIKSKVGAAAAAATSTLNPVAGNNQAFVASYTTQKWTGNLEARGINTDTGVVNENANWCVENVTAGSCSSPSTVISENSGDTTTYYCSTPNSTTCPDGTLEGTDCKVPMATSCTGTMNAMVSDTTDTRTIKTANDAGTGLVEFDTTYRAAHSSYFDSSKLSGLSQWPLATDVTTLANNMRAFAPGDNLLRFLRGNWGREERTTVSADRQYFRKRDAVLGDALESQPAFMGAPIFSYPYSGYSEFKTAQASRAGTVYIGTNDGMMHAFNSDTGVERWAYIPSMVIPNMWKLADKQYQDKHSNYVNGSPITQDVCTANCANAVTGGATDPVWKTILVAGLNGGGRGYYALDITDPTTPKLMWEFTTTSGIGAAKDDDLGYTFGQPVVTRLSDGTWVVAVSSGYDNGTDSATKVSGSFVANSPAGSGKGYLYVLNAGTGAILKKISTGVGTASAPSGLAKIAGYNAEPGGNKASYIYGGDLLGNLWRFDINSSTSAVIGTGIAFKFATLFSDSGATKPQPIMTTPILGTILGKRVVFIGTGKYLETSDLTDTQVQTQYAIKDDDATTTLTNARNSLVAQFLITNPDGTATRLSATSSGASTTGTNPVDFGVNRGWYVDLPDSKERVNIDARLVSGTLIVPTIVPSSTECNPGGFGWLNFFDYRTGGAVVPQPGLASVRYDATIVGINVLFIGGNPVVEVVTSNDPTPTKDPNVQFQASAGVFVGKRVLWRELVP